MTINSPLFMNQPNRTDPPWKLQPVADEVCGSWAAKLHRRDHSNSKNFKDCERQGEVTDRVKDRLKIG